MARQTPYLAAGLALCGVLCSARPAAAQLTASGPSFLVAPVGVRGTASAYDPQNNRFLVVAAYGPVTGRLVKPDGTFATDPFQIDLVTSFAHYPSVAYSPHVDGGRGGFLVTWHQNIGPAGNRVHARLISASGVPLGDPVMLGIEATWWESSPSVDYATASQVFMVTWRIGAYQIRAARISITGQNLDAGSNPGTALAGAGILVTTTGGERDPSIAYNPTTDHFLVSSIRFPRRFARLCPVGFGGQRGRWRPPTPRRRHVHLHHGFDVCQRREQVLSSAGISFLAVRPGASSTPTARQAATRLRSPGASARMTASEWPTTRARAPR